MIKKISNLLSSSQWRNIFVILLILVWGLLLVAFINQFSKTMGDLLIEKNKEESSRQTQGDLHAKLNTDELVKELLFGKINFSPGAHQITISIIPGDDNINGGNPIQIIFMPDTHCPFGEGRACIYSFSSSQETPVTLISVHSGIGAEAESFRNVLEGTGNQQAMYTEDQVLQNVKSLTGAGIILSQGSEHLMGLELQALVRITPANVEAYMALPVEETLEYVRQVTDIDSNIFDQDLILFETCGWRLPGEEIISGSEYTSSSIYLGFILPIDKESIP